MSGRPGLHARFPLLVTLVAIAIQLPTVSWLCLRTGTPWPAVVAALVSFPYLRRFESPWQTAEPALTTYLALGWWSACLVFDPAAPSVPSTLDDARQRLAYISRYSGLRRSAKNAIVASPSAKPAKCAM